MDNLNPGRFVAKCLSCNSDNHDFASFCKYCGASLASSADGETIDVTTPSSDRSLSMPSSPGAIVSSDAAETVFPAGRSSVPPVSGPRATYSSASPSWRSASGGLLTLEAGVDFGPRYRIDAMLGQGGMGAVYKAYDKDLDRTVALKLIRPEYMADAEAMRRFKQELLLASKVSHRNILRTHDLGDVDTLKFISMAYVEGEDLHHLLKMRGRLTIDESIKIARQLCEALEAAHAEGIIHRDLKPQNVLLDHDRNAYISDFGLAKSLESTAAGLTHTGELMGTPRYMSPEQVEGAQLDHRCDLYPLGLMMYEMLTGEVPFTGDSMLKMMYQRTKEPPRSPKLLNPEVPDYLARIILRCLEKDPALRYQSAGEILDDLDASGAPSRTLRRGSNTIVAERQLSAAPRYWKWAAAALAVLVLAFAGLFFFRERTPPELAAKNKVVKILVADFRNDTGEEVFDGTLEPMFTLAMEGARFITSPIRREQALRIAAQLQAGASRLDESLARLVAVREGISVVVSGAISRQGGGYSISVNAIDPATGKKISFQQIEAKDKDKVLVTVGTLAVPIRKALGDATPESDQLAAAETYTSASLEAAHAYAQAQGLQYAGKTEEAVRGYLKAVALDGNLGRAYSGLATLSRNMGRPEDAERYFKEALARIDRMSEREKYRTRGVYYMTIGNFQKAVEEYTALVKQYPADTAGHANLAVSHGFLRNMGPALEEARIAVEINPKSLPQRYNLAEFMLYTGDFTAAGREARIVLDENPSYPKPYLMLALSELLQGELTKAAETYRRLEQVNVWGASCAASGLADLALYEGRLSEGAAMLEKAAAADLARKQPDFAASKLITLAEVQLLRAQKAAALAAADRAVANSKEPNVKFSAARIYLQAGQETKARSLAAELDASLVAEPRAYAKLMEGLALSRRDNLPGAIKVFQEAQKLLDTWTGRFLLGVAYLEAGAFAEAHSEFDLCMKRRGEAAVLFRDDFPTARLVPAIHYYLGRAQEGLKSPGAAESYRAFLSIREKGDDDPLVADARRRLAGR